MKKTKITLTIEYLSSIFVLSYLFIHNIFLVLIGIIFSLYLINIDFINRIIVTFNKNSISTKVDTDLNTNNKEMKSYPINIKTKKEDPKLTLVETIEELGFIPSIEKNDESNVAL